MTLRDVDIYLKRKALAEGAGNPHEKAEALKQVRAMELEHPGIRVKASIVQQALDAEEDPFRTVSGAENTAPGWKSDLGRFLQGLAAQSAARFADDLAGDISGANRQAPLERGECVFTTHGCGNGQVCLEMRVTRKDVLRSKARAAILEGVEEELIRLAEEE